MTKEEAGKQMELLQLSLERIQKEIKTLQNQFCGRGNHYFRGLWAKVCGGPLYGFTGHICVLCSKKEPPKDGSEATFKQLSGIPRSDVIVKDDAVLI